MKIQLTILCGPERHSWINPELHIGVGQWSHDPRIELFHQELSYGYFTSQEARNVACEKFLANPEFNSPTDCLIMIDNDTNPVNPKSGTMNNLMDLPLMGLPIVGCPVPVIHGNEWMLNAMYEEGDSWRPMSVDELSKPDNRKLALTDVGLAVKVDAIGFGVVCIQRGVLEKIIEPKRFSVYDGARSKVWHSPRDIFKPGDTSHIPYVVRWRDDRGATVKGEDFLFCKRAKELSIQTYVSPQHYCGHLHSVDFGKLPALKYSVKKGPTPTDYGITGPCPPITEWAIEPVLAKWLIAFLADNPGANVLELGSGISTLVIDQHQKIGVLVSLEHDQSTANNVQSFMRWFRSCVWHSPLVDGFYSKPPANFPYELMLVDGPPAHLSPHGRAQARKFFPLLNPGALIVLDDADREGERHAMESWTAYHEVEFVERVGRAAVMRKL